MKIIIAGAGEVGFHLAKLLSFESQDITLIDTNRDSLANADTHLDIRVVRGDATSISVLQDSRVNDTDLVIAVTSSETTNITVCVLAKQLGAKRTIARISNTEFIDRKDEVGFKKFGIDELISPESLAANEIELLLGQSAFNDTYEFENGALTMIGLSLSRTSAFVGKSVKEVAKLNPELRYVPIALQRYGTQYTIIPRGDTQFKEGDQVYFTTCKNGLEQIFKLTGKVRQEIKNVMILGGSKIGYKTAKDLCKSNFNVKLIESSKDKAFEIADDIPGCLVINGDGRNVDLLTEESIEDMDAFISVTGNSETNIMSCLVAKSKGVKKAIALVENMDYFQLSHSIGIDTLINKKLLAANNIFRYVRKGEVVAMTKLNNMNAELLEFVVSSHAKVCNKKIKDLDFPVSAIIGGVIRDGEGIIALGDFEIKSGDRVVVCCLPQSIGKVEKLFI
ncbi:Trk system potassium transporter TrkA [Aequorivita lipolytica]|uniref:Trk system potassium uptake protein TrkA n=1 Tax=Aequorivita lipolytica TaxID=153267 RepID=A0A5C6YQN7_9FLAO|nr:Trk system potassium transporter TrkA [Aequorivita lipolytica]TXD69743.1 Trk system potassium transporter TrkA [Aequorivita lipolytica]SRX50448.1 Trk system potassium uptake protein TrkA [Aequorivita lipolytica]